MDSLNYVLASYGVAFLLLGAFGAKLVWERFQLRSLISSLEIQNDTKN